ncbi:MAG: RNA chaperone Hfq [Oscillospiraceae bacterium]|nr:RNA chaperone Hfq [Oscillospiraceae bacterium]
MQKSSSLQDNFLSRAKKDRIHVTFYLVNGYQMHGYIGGHDPFVVILNTDGRQQVIYKHAISTIAPERPIPLDEEDVPPEA